jgi:hypothetical protein
VRRITSRSERSQVPASELAAYDAVVAITARRGDPKTDDVSPYTSAMLSTPLIGLPTRELGRAIRLAPDRSQTYTRVDYEIAVHTLGAEAGLIEHHHILDALTLGVRPEALEAIAHSRLDALDAEERVIVNFVSQLVRRTMSDTAWDAVRDLRSERGAVELSICAGFTWATILWRLAWDDAGITLAELDSLLASHRDGTLTLPDATTATRVGTKTS